MNYNSFFYKILMLLLSFLFFLTLIEFEWWWLGSISEFKVWYKNLGLLIWILKGGFFFSWIIFTIKFIARDYIRYPIFCTYVFFALILKNQHPFSNLSVYNTFPENSFLFYIEDKDGKIFNHGINYRSADLVDIFDTFSKKYSRDLSASQLSNLGKRTLLLVKKSNNFQKGNCYKLIRITNFMAEKKMISQKQILYNECD